LFSLPSRMDDGDTSRCFEAALLAVCDAHPCNRVPIVNCNARVDRARLACMLADINVRPRFTVERPKYAIADYYPVVELHIIEDMK